MKINNLETRFTLYIVTIVSALILFLGILIYIIRYQSQIKFGNELIQKEKDGFYALLQVNYQERNNNVRIALQYAHELFYNNGTIGFDTAHPENIYAINQISKSIENVNIFPMTKAGKSIYKDYTIVDAIKNKTNVAATIFQRIPQGWIRISTNVVDFQGQRAINTYIQNDSPVAQSIEKGTTYFGRAFVVSDWYITAYEPIWVKGKIEGILYVGKPEKDMGYLTDIIKSKVIFENGFLMLVNEEGKSILSPDIEESKTTISNTNLATMIKNKEGVIEVEDADNNSYLDTYKYFEPYKCFIIVRTYKEDFIYKPLRSTIYIILLGIVIAVLLFYFIMKILMKTITRPINTIVDVLNKLSKGIIPEKINVKAKDEIRTILESTNKLIEGQKEIAEFAFEIGKKNYKHNFKPLSNEDVLGNALIEMRNDLVLAQEEEKKRDEEQKQRNWATQGIAKFAEILRRNNNDLEKLASEIIIELIRYTNMNQGGLFIVNDDDKNNIFLELLAFYAYDRQKYLNKKIEIGEGLVGACFQEKLPIYLTDVPEHYINITSGLGDAPPRCLYIIPLKLNNEVLGVIELASFQELAPYEREFIEKVAESIASTISSVKINVHTALLLEKSQQQAEEMRAQEEEMRQNFEELQATQEEMLRRQKENEQLLQALNKSCFYFEYSLDGRIIKINDVVKDNLKIKEEDIIGKHHKDFIDYSFENDSNYSTFWQNLSNNKVQKKISNQKYNNISVWLSETYYPMSDNNGNITKIINIAFDITEQKKLELEAIANTKEILSREQYLKGLSDAVDNEYLRIETDVLGNIKFINETGLKIVNISKSEFLQLNIRTFMPKQLIETGNFDKFWNKLASGIHQKGGHQYIFGDKEVWLYCTYTPVLNENGQIDRIIIIGNDITIVHNREIEAKKNLEELIKLKEEIEELKKNSKNK